jgi:excisionase family DNA binding protein
MQDPARTELLDIREAAALLRVSPTSLRRWTNAGRLPCVRIGGRRERRFRRSDLLAFAGTERAPTPNHFCGLYSSDLNRARAIAAFLAAGLHAGAACVLVAGKVVQRAVVELLEAGVRPGRLSLAEYHDTATAQLEFWRTRLRRSVAAGVPRVYVAADVAAGALGRLPFDEILEYEAEFARSIARAFPVTTLCLYDARRVSGLDVAALLHRHDGGAHAGYRLEH